MPEKQVELVTHCIFEEKVRRDSAGFESTRAISKLAGGLSTRIVGGKLSMWINRMITVGLKVHKAGMFANTSVLLSALVSKPRKRLTETSSYIFFRYSTL